MKNLKVAYKILHYAQDDKMKLNYLIFLASR